MPATGESTPPPPTRARTAGRTAIGVALGAVAIAAPVLSTASPRGAWGGALLAAGTLAGAMVVNNVGERLLVRLLVRLLAWIRMPWPRWMPRYVPPFVLSLVLALAATAATMAGVRSVLHSRPCGVATQLRIVTYPGGVEPYTHLANAFARSHRGPDGCPRYAAHVYDLTTDQLMDGLAWGWSYAVTARTELAATPSPPAQRPSGPAPADPPGSATTSPPGALAGYHNRPQPDIVVAESDEQVDRIRQRLQRSAGAARPRFAGAGAPLGRTPLVDVVRTDQATPDATASGGATLHAQPDSSTAGRLATALLYTTAGLQGALDPVAARTRRQAENAALRVLGPEPSTEQDAEIGLLCRLAAAQTPASALVTRQAYLLASHGCGAGLTTQQHMPTATVTRRVLRLDWSQSTGSAAAGRETPATAARAFERWLRHVGRGELAAIGLCPAARVAVDEATEPCQGVGTATDLAPATVSAALEQYQQAGQARRILMLLDTSGSMSSTAAGGTDLDLARSGLRRIAGHLAAQDTVQVWGFPGPGSGSTVPLLPRPGPPGGGGDRAGSTGWADPVDAALADLRARGTTPLRQAVTAALDHLGTSAGPAAVVLVTDDQGVSTMHLGSHSTPVHILALDGAACPGTGHSDAPGTCQQVHDSIDTAADTIARRLDELG